MTEAAIEECAMQFTLLLAGRRHELFRQGDPSNHFYCLMRGCVRVARLAEDGSDFTTRVIGSSELFGEDSLFNDGISASTATSLCDSIVAVCSAARMRSLLMRHPILSMNIARYLREDHNRTLDRFERLAYKPVRERLLALLHELANQCGGGQPYGENYEVKLTHFEIASLIGSTRETVSSELSKLAQAGLISRRGRKILITATNEAA
jgi:CRP/FNR family transcriptional regulator